MSTHNDPQRDPPRTTQPHAAEPDTFERCLPAWSSTRTCPGRDVLPATHRAAMAATTDNPFVLFLRKEHMMEDGPFTALLRALGLLPEDDDHEEEEEEVGSDLPVSEEESARSIETGISEVDMGVSDVGMDADADSS